MSHSLLPLSPPSPNLGDFVITAQRSHGLRRCRICGPHQVSREVTAALCKHGIHHVLEFLSDANCICIQAEFLDERMIVDAIDAASEVHGDAAADDEQTAGAPLPLVVWSICPAVGRDSWSSAATAWCAVHWTSPSSAYLDDTPS
jgi:hypothetical protein